jgi:lambda family phage tail tape measure protein
MANQRYVLEFSLQDVGNTLKSGKKDADAFRGSLDSIIKATDRVNKSGKGGWKNAMMGNTEYDTARGVTGTGASGRDFGKQAQGLDGLVRLYATYAANLFAVSAAFRALSDAMDTTNMIKGLDQLGASSGVALGGLAKQFAQASDGSISLREAMEATAKATSAGMSKKQLLELGTVAKGASQALGVNMSDAVSRLTRGISKLEPELLDELGLFTKVGKSAEDYARSVGKSVDSLTDFEKRQAFANAVLAEGRQKFGEIAATANPYDKLLASLKNVATQILSVVNTVIAPIAKILADNTALIGIAIAAAAIKITQQALPALAGWRIGLKFAAEDAAKRAHEINTSFGEAFVKRAEARVRLPQLESDLAAQKKLYSEKSSLFLKEQNELKNNSALTKAIGSGQLLTARQLSSIQGEITKKQDSTNASTQKHVEGLRGIYDIQTKMVASTKEIAKGNDIVEEQMGKKSRLLSEEWQREKIVAQERAKTTKLTLLAGVGERVSKEGLSAGFGGFYKETLASKDLNRIDKFKTVTTGALLSVGTAASILGKSLSGALVYLEIAVAVFGILNYAFSKNGKEVDILASSLDSLSESTKTAYDVAKKYADTLTVESINAKANAFGNLADDITTATTNLLKADAAASGFDKFIDGWKTIWGGDIRTQFTKGFTSSINAAIATAPAGEIRDNLEKKLISSLGTLDIEKGLDLVPTDKVVEKAREISKILAETDKILKGSQAVTQEVSQTAKATTEAFLNFSNAVYGQSPLQTFLNTSVKGLFALKNAFNDALGSAAEFEKVLNGTANLQFLPESAVSTILDLGPEFQKIRQEQNQAKVGLKATEDGIEKIKKKLQEVNPFFSEGIKLKTDQTQLEGSIDKYKKIIYRTTGEIAALGKQAAQALADASTQALDRVLAEFRLKEKQLKINTQQQVLASIPIKTEETIKEATRLAIASINVEMQLQKSQQNLVNSVDSLKASLDVRNAQETLAIVSAGAYRTPGAREEAVAKAQGDLESKQRVQRILDTSSISGITKEDRENPAVQRLLQNKASASLAETAAQEKIKLEKLKEANSFADLAFTNAKELLNAEIAKKEADLGYAKTQAGVMGDQSKIAQLELDAKKYVEERRRMLEVLPTAQQNVQTDIAGRFGAPSAVTASAFGKIGQNQGTAQALGAVTGATTIDSAEWNSLLTDARKDLAQFMVQADIRSLSSNDALDAQKSILAAAREQLEVQKNSGALTTLEAAQKAKQLTYQDAEIEKVTKLEQIKRERLQSSLEWANKVLENGGVETEQLTEQYNLIVAKAGAATSAAQRDFEAKLKSADITAKLADKQTQYENVFKQSFDSMADAMVEFARTGEISFKSLISTMLAGLLQVELKLQSEALYKLFRPVIGAGFSAVFGPAPGSLDYGPVGPSKAKGGAYDAGLEMFAKGGMFTNSIVSQPTLFKFAKGTGMMGEAGPEAIMPLKRDNNGNLGVRSTQQGNVDIVVNNYGNEKATTKETTDSRGNRRIEVVIGDMVAGEMSRSGSSLQQTLSSTYGTRPVIGRR